MVIENCILNGKLICCNHLTPERPTAKEKAVRQEELKSEVRHEFHLEYIILIRN